MQYLHGKHIQEYFFNSFVVDNWRLSLPLVEVCFDNI